jgi:hypothetical protein
VRATDSFCLATATYLSSCSCRTQHVIRRGEGVPRCPQCGAVVDWEFVRSDYMPTLTMPTPRASASPAEDARPPRDA